MTKQIVTEKFYDITLKLILILVVQVLQAVVYTYTHMYGLDNKKVGRI